jgi:hypothetical protein
MTRFSLARYVWLFAEDFKRFMESAFPNSSQGKEAWEGKIARFWLFNRMAEINMFRSLQKLVDASDPPLADQIKIIHYLLDFAVLSLENFWTGTTKFNLVLSSIIQCLLIPLS